MQEHEDTRQSEERHDREAFYERKHYYVSVQAGSILEDPEAAAFELEIVANEEELNRLQELFEELSSEDEAEMAHFTSHPFGSAPVERMNSAYDGFIEGIYKQLYELGTPETKRHIKTMGLFPEGTLS
ncbi:hypothetical protein [Paenibacillus spongiae]|uniref:Hydrolase n=1 Tax=Paenibacillus spongiae TaxID=2909671 RepID=A0ABY5S2S6_9BACL|nr:hypothetical protein [Paenibacillus spongiae]UVI28201.1 hypothetical protein L1F29_22465 [Paenibacillus spongiae]